MAAPQTHFVATFGFRMAFTVISGVAFTVSQLFWVYFWGCLMDFLDHFTSSSYTRDVFFVRMPKFFKGGDFGSPSQGVKNPNCWLHIWPGAIFSLVCGLALFPQAIWWAPSFFWFQHVLLDKFQKNDGSYLDIPFFYPLKKKKWHLRDGYPIKSRKEILISTMLAFMVLLVEIYINFF